MYLAAVGFEPARERKIECRAVLQAGKRVWTVFRYSIRRLANSDDNMSLLDAMSLDIAEVEFLAVKQLRYYFSLTGLGRCMICNSPYNQELRESTSPG